MDNTFITQYFDWNAQPPARFRWVNAVLRKFGFGARLVSPLATGSISNVEQRMNLFHLLSGVLAYDVPGQVVEFGTAGGTTAAVLRKVIDELAPDRPLHVFDLFENPPAEELLSVFQKCDLRPPTIHTGWLMDTVPVELPETIAFAHLDLGPSRSPEILEESVAHVVASAYPRLSAGAVFMLTDYCDPNSYARSGYSWPHTIDPTRWWNQYPQVKLGCDRALQGKPERVSSLYSGIYSVGYFRKRVE